MKLLFASDSFKGTLSSEQTAQLLTKAALEVFGPCETAHVPVADGGEGTVEAVIAAENGTKLKVQVHGPLMEPVDAQYGLLDKNRAIIEMASASGLPMVAKEKRNPLHTTTYGTGELIKDALDRGIRNISIAIGGSATNDGGIGAMRALGVRFLDKDGNELHGFGADLEKIIEIDDSNLDPRIKDTQITVMCDVTNPLCGKSGATYTFGPQKGATQEMLVKLETGMENYRSLIKQKYGIDCNDVPGTGAAGGLGAALLVFLNATMKSGIEEVLSLIHFDERLDGVSLVVTGEGRTDWQSAFGKVMMGVGKHAKAKGIPAVGLSGSLGVRAMQMFDYGIETLITTVDSPMPLEEALERAEELYYQGAIRMFRCIRVGMQIQSKM